ncbi:hypothetical protein [Streptomyces sp. SPB074]|uniref:hypothetical protein n=1 Tax=Streptomyces sp. (strain SPB074) TaxID=465543 RepID=UPI00017F17E4|nr:hypothetical protein [Streptomyces sp. SPB074]
MVTIGVLFGVLALLVVAVVVKVLRRPYSGTRHAEGLRIEEAARRRAQADRSRYGAYSMHGAVVPPRDGGRP